VHIVFKNRNYLRIVRFERVEYPGKHEPLIDLPAFEQVQATLEAHLQSGD